MTTTLPGAAPLAFTARGLAPAPLSRALVRTVGASLLGPRPQRPDAARPVVLLHGLASSPRVLLPLERHLERTLGREVWRVRLSATGRCDLRDCARRVYERIERGVAERGVERADVVGHSMGGLVATWLLKRLDGGRRLRTVVTLGTPHRGAPLARLGAAVLGGLCPALAQMAPDSPLLDELKWLAVPDGCSLVSVSAVDDGLVPERFTRLTPLPGHRNIRVLDAHHGTLLLSRGVFSLVSDLLAEPEPAPMELADAA
jgi:triacylglycerol lipase